MSLSPGDRVGRYVVDARIGDGPRGSVYRATRDPGGRVVALKVLDEHASANAASVIASARAAPALDHPNIAAIVEVGEHEGRVYIARELIRGSTAGARKSETSLEGRIRWLIESAGALHAAHMRGVAHGAVREGNVLVEEDGTLKLTDFAIGAAAEAADDRRAWATLANALIDDVEVTPPMRDAIDAADGSLDRAASMLERVLSATRDLPVAEGDAPVRTARTGATTAARGSPNVMRFVVPLVIIAASVVALYMTRRTPRTANSVSVVATPPESPRPTGSRSPQATSLFNGAMQSMHDASSDLARAGFNDALRVDPSFAEAHLRRALVSIVLDDTSREHFGRAASLRNALSPHARVLLDAFEPVMRSEPSFDACVSRMQAASASNPTDADFSYHLGFARWLAGDFHGAIAEMDRTLVIDPSMAVASRARGYLLSLLDEEPQAIAEYERCLTLSPAATSCLHNLAEAQARNGDCKGTEATARRMIAISPSSANGYWFLARALTALNQDEAASLAIREHLRRVPAESRRADEASFDVRTALLGGDFARAELSLNAWDAALDGDTDEWAHAAVTEMKMEVALETGRAREAREAATPFLKTHSVLTGVSVHAEVSLIILGVLHRAQGISNEALNAKRNEARLASNDAGASWGTSARAGEAWIVAFVTSVASPSEAREALAMRANYPPLIAEILRDPVEIDGMIGRIFFLAGRKSEAVAPLDRAARSCFALDAPLFQTQLLKLLADIELAQGETKKACLHYGEVLRRWGSATLPSATAKSAKSSFRNAGCEPIR